jgi:hypothetical protein
MHVRLVGWEETVGRGPGWGRYVLLVDTRVWYMGLCCLAVVVE